MKRGYFFIKTSVKSVLSFFQALVRRRDRVVSLTPSGFPLLEGWDSSPESRLVKSCQAVREAVRPVPRAALYCYEGSHAGEVFPLRSEVENMGTAAHSSLVVTPAAGHAESSYQFMLNSHIRLIAGPGASFRLNGNEERESFLYDYDQLDCLGNRFLFLELQSVGTAEAQR